MRHHLKLRRIQASLLNARASSHEKRDDIAYGNAHNRKELEFMADLIVVFWRDIPAQVIVKKGRQSAKRELPLRFIEAIDMCAMRSGAKDSSDYLEDWRKAPPIPVGDDLDAEADQAAAKLETEYDKARLVALVNSGGKENA